MQPIRLTFLYPSHYPVVGGSSLHGYYLACGLAKAGFQVFSFPQQADGCTTCRQATLWQILKSVLQSRVIYLRISPKGRSHMFIPWLKVLGKKLVMEINGPTEEWLITGRIEASELNHVDASLRRQLKRADAVITISRVMQDWCHQILQLEGVHVVENGGNRYSPDDIKVDADFERTFTQFKNSVRQVILWSGNYYPWQGIDFIQQVINEAGPEMGFVLVTDKPEVFQGLNHKAKCWVLPLQPVQHLQYMVTHAHAGLAAYGNYDWFRLQTVYNSSLKLYEYLANRLWVAGNYPLWDSPQYYYSQSPAELLAWLQQKQGQQVPDNMPYRSWDQSVHETINIIQSIC